MKKKSAIVIGSGFGGLGVALLLAKAGHAVRVFEKNDQLGGRAGVLEKDGFRFDMGPSWYLMPDVFRQYFELLGEDVDELLDLVRLDPSYRIFFKDEEGMDPVDLTSDLARDRKVFDDFEDGAGDKLEEYLKVSGEQYKITYEHFLFKNFGKWSDVFNADTAKWGRGLPMLRSLDSHVKRYFSDERLVKIMEYQQVFLGNSPYRTPALYNIMNHIDFEMGVYYPQGGIRVIVEKMIELGESYGVEFVSGAEVEEIVVENGQAVGVKVGGEVERGDMVISNGDLHHTETELLEQKWRTYSDGWWDRRVMSPSAFIMYLGVEGRLDSLVHHNLVFAKDWERNFAEIFDAPQWPTDPSFYVCAPSVTDLSVAPEGHENLFVLVPIASGLDYTEKSAREYGDGILDVMAKEFGVADLRERVVSRTDFSVKDFASRYHSYRGTGLGLAHTLGQTAIFRPDNVSKRVKDLYFVGAGTNPGIGMPICLISAELVVKRLVGDTSDGPLQDLKALAV